MEYQYKDLEENFEEMKSQDGGVWRYIPSKSFHEEAYIQEHNIFGDVDGTLGDTSLRYLHKIQQGEDKTMRIYRHQKRLSFFDKAVGYIPVCDPNGKAGYVRIRAKSMKKIMSVILLLIIIIGGSIAVLLNQQTDSGLDEQAIAYQLPGGVKNSDPDSILLPGYDVLEMNFETQKVEAALLNPEGNDCYFKFHIILKADNHELYQTGLIKPGMAVTSFTVNKKLAKGEYPIIIKVDAVDLKDTKSSYNGGAIEAILKVE